MVEHATIGVGTWIKGNDMVTAGPGSTISLGTGNDTVNAGANDTISFGIGDGHDTVAFGVSPSPAVIGNETINGFNPAHDVIEFNKIALLENYAAVLGATTQTGPDSYIIKADANDTVTLNIIGGSLSSKNFHFS